MTAAWRPDDGELDEVARSLDRHEPSHERAEQARTALLAAAAGRTQLPRRSRAPYAVAGVAFAAAAAVAIWIAVRPGGEPSKPVVAAAPKQVISPIGDARFERVSDWADFLVRLDDGKLGVQVANLDTVDRFRVTTADAEVETRGASFDIAAKLDHLAAVDVRDGSVAIRRLHEQVVILSAGQSWTPPVQTAIREDVVIPAPSEPAPAPVPPRQAPIERPHREPPLPPRSEPKQVEAAPANVEVPAPKPVAPPAKPAPDPGELEFRAGMASLRTGDAASAAHSFATACGLAKHAALGDDACFWSGAAARRAGDTPAARSALAAFLHDFPGSARAPEAAALLGWIEYDAGELDAAEALFHRAEHDRVPQVRDSAQRGLTAIDRKRHAP